MTAPTGLFQEFNPENNWTSYVSRLKSFFYGTNVIDDKKKVAILLASVGAETYERLADLALPDDPTDKTFEQLTGLLSAYSNPKPLLLSERVKFQQRMQLPTESVAEYALALTKLTKFCEYGDGLPIHLCDRFVSGLLSEPIQRYLITQGEADHAKVVQSAIAMETTLKGVASFHSSNASSATHKVFDSRPSGGARRAQKSLPPRKDTGSQSEQRGGQSEQRSGQTASRKCLSCGASDHRRDECRHRNTRCNGCGKLGHIKSACMSATNSRSAPLHIVNEEQDLEYYNNHVMVSIPVHSHVIERVKPLILEIQIGATALWMEVDTGAGATIVNKQTYSQFFSEFPLQPLLIHMTSYDGHRLPMEGVCEVPVLYNRKGYRLPLCVASDGAVPLLGRDWLQAFGLLAKTGKLLGAVVHTLEAEEMSVDRSKTSAPVNLAPDPPRESTVDCTLAPSLQQVLAKHANVFREEVGRYNVSTVHLAINKNIPAIYLKAYPVPLAMKPRVEEELKRLVELQIITPTAQSAWATPILHVVKSDGTIKLAGCYNRTVNKVILPNTYPLPLFADVTAKLAGGDMFSTLDCNNAYNQLELDDASKQLCTINTHIGLFTVNRLFYGISTATAIFQRTMDQLTAGVGSAQPYIDDSAVTGRTDVEHLQNLDRLLAAFNNAGMTLSRRKCKFMQPTIEFLGLHISKSGVRPLDSKLAPLRNGSRPTDVTSLKSFLGLINYYGKFVPNLSTLLSSLYALTKDGVEWSWGQEQESAWTEVKTSVSAESALTHFDQSKKVYLTVDASPVGVGAVLSHMDGSGQHLPIAFASSLLSSAQRNYAQIEREGYAIIYGIRKFHHYLFGRKFYLRTDHKPLVAIFGEKKGCNQVVAARLHRWAVFLSAYDFDIAHVPARDNQMADALSRNPQPVVDLKEDVDFGANKILQTCVSDFPISAPALKSACEGDKQFQLVKQCIRDGWSNRTPDLAPFYRHREGLSVFGEFLFLSDRLVVPISLRDVVLRELHAGHYGIVRTKPLARATVWWPAIDDDIERIVRACEPCQRGQSAPPRMSSVRGPVPEEVWGRIHIDFAGPVFGKTFLLAVDAKSKWCEARAMTSTTAEATVAVMDDWFTQHGLPVQVHSDNGPQFASEKFKQFLGNNGIHQTFSPPYHPATNGAVEGFVKTFKHQVEKFVSMRMSLHEAVNRFLQSYRSTPHVTTKKSPAEMFLGRPFRSQLHLLNPRLLPEVSLADVARSFVEGQAVFVRDYRSQVKWVPGVVTRRASTSTYDVEVASGVIWSRHADQMRIRSTLGLPRSIEEGTEFLLPPSPTQNLPPSAASVTPAQPPTPAQVVMPPGQPPAQAGSSVVRPPPGVGLLPRPQRVRRPPQYFGFD